MKRLIQFASCTFMIMAISACFSGIRGSGNMKTETRPVKGFRSVEFSSSGKLIIDQSRSESLTVEAEDNLLEYITTEVRDGRLIIGTKPMVNIRSTRSPVFRLGVKTLEALEMRGSGDVEAGDISGERLVAEIIGSGSMTLGKISAPDFRLKISGSGSFETRRINSRIIDIDQSGSGGITIDSLDGDKLTVSQSSSGSLKVSGTVDDQQITMDGSGSYIAGDLDTLQTRIDLSGSGSADLNVSEKLDAAVTGSGSVVYSGNPAVQKKVTGSGSVSKR